MRIGQYLIRCTGVTVCKQWKLGVQESRNKAPLPLASLVYSYMQLIAPTTQVNSVPWQLTSHATWADESFKHLHITTHPQILVLELQAPMGACPGQYGICMMTHISAIWFCYSQYGVLFVPQDMVQLTYHIDDSHTVSCSMEWSRVWVCV